MGQKDWPICLCITSILGKPFEVGGSNRSSSTATANEYLQTTVHAFLTCFLNHAESVEEKNHGSFGHTEKVTNVCPVRHHPARSPLEMDAPGHHPPKKLGKSLESGDIKSKQSVL